ncbi:DoxX family protein [Aromatoleum evansii]|uniref:DoxX family protein n=1 Tax=Aromatoleum evansii TaxID=59406 RepID=A0ABZ1AHF5_AROEV|nr:DoxX family protein [Aromatoleum evansii]NMG32282.1 DoxX family membrane protein [Aromatoleum evansii]WRL45303.1 DoxX family protein [Aromatoleum evansii]
MKDATALVARILLALIFIVAGWGKLGAGYAGTQQYMASMGVSGALLPLVIFAELGGGLGILFGALTRLAAAGLAAFCILSALFFHTDFANQIQSIMFMKNLAIAGGMLMLAVHGAGAWSLDTWWQARRK